MRYRLFPAATAAYTYLAAERAAGRTGYVMRLRASAFEVRSWD